MPTTPPFDAEYAACPIWPSNAATDAVLMITPRSSSGQPIGSVLAIRSAPSRSTLNVPIRLTFTTRLKSSSGKTPFLDSTLIADPVPAQLTTTRTRTERLGDVERGGDGVGVGDVGRREPHPVAQFLGDLFALRCSAGRGSPPARPRRAAPWRWRARGPEAPPVTSATASLISTDRFPFFGGHASRPTGWSNYTKPYGVAMTTLDSSTDAYPTVQGLTIDACRRRAVDHDEPPGEPQLAHRDDALRHRRRGRTRRRRRPRASGAARRRRARASARARESVRKTKRAAAQALPPRSSTRPTARSARSPRCRSRPSPSCTARQPGWPRRWRSPATSYWLRRTHFSCWRSRRSA